MSAASVYHPVGHISNTAPRRLLSRRKTLLAMVFKLCQAAEKKWRILNGSQIIPDVIQGVRFIDGVRQDKTAA